MRSVSGTYQGVQVSPNQGALSAVVRVDVDRIRPHALVLNEVSGDFFRGNDATFLFSWTAHSIEVQAHRHDVKITGDVTTTVSNAAIQRFEINIHTRAQGKSFTAIVRFIRADNSESTYECVRTSKWFRQVTLQLDVCRSVRPPRVRLPRGILPVYDTHAVSTRPKQLPQRTLTIESAFADAGVHLLLAPHTMEIDDRPAYFQSWSNAELHLTMELNSRQLRKTTEPWPRWQIWGLMAGRHDDPTNRGLMFDDSTSLDSQTRQGFAVFLDHPELRRSLVRNPADTVDPDAVRMLLRVLVHEVAHTFNLRHPNATTLSWMNSPHVFDSEHTGTSYWEQFMFSFATEELTHLRHGEFPDVAMGGSLAFPVFADSSSFQDLPEVENCSRWTIDIRSQEYFDFLEPVELEVRIRNCSRRSGITIDSLPDPDAGNLKIFIRRPDRRVIEFRPLARCYRRPTQDKALTLAPCTARNTGRDRVSCLVDLTTGTSGCRLFDVPGNYEVRVVFQSFDQLASSAVHQIRVGIPLTRTADRLAQDYFNAETSLSLALNISRADSMQSSFRLLESIAAGEYSQVDIGAGVIAKIARRTAKAVARPFRQPVERARGLKMKVTASEDAAAAKKLIETSLQCYRQILKTGSRTHNLGFADTALTAISIASKMGDSKFVTAMTRELLTTLRANGVNKNVCESISWRVDKQISGEGTSEEPGTA
jgi:hypothetical protein